MLGTLGFLIGLAGIALAVAQWVQGRRMGEQLNAVLDLLVERATPEQVATIEKSVGVADELNAELADAIARLPEREKLVVTLYYYEELTMSEIADVLGVPEQRASAIHSKAILRLKARLQTLPETRR